MDLVLVIFRRDARLGRYFSYIILQFLKFTDMVRSREISFPTRGSVALRSLLPVSDANILIKPAFESSITWNPMAQKIEAGIDQAISNIESFIANPITVSIRVRLKQRRSLC